MAGAHVDIECIENGANVGGIEVAFDIANKGGRLRLFDLSPVSPKLNLRVGGSPGLVVMGEES